MPRKKSAYLNTPSTARFNVTPKIGIQLTRAKANQRAILVGHNAHFDLNFLNAAVARVEHKRNPFHPFSVFDTVSLGGVAYGQTVLGRAMQAAGLAWNGDEAHSAVYDAERTAELFCKIANAWRPQTPAAETI